MGTIKVARVITRLNVGGPTLHTVLLTAGLDRNRFHSTLITGSIGPGEGDMSYYARDKGVTIVPIRELSRELSFKNDLVAFFKIYRLLRREGPRILHTHTAKAGTLGRCAAAACNLFCLGRSKKILLVHTFHGHVLSGYFNRYKNIFFTWIERILARWTDKIIAVSDSVKEELVSFRIAPPGKIDVVALGFELDKFLSVGEAGDPAGPRKVGIVGRLVPIKNHRLFLEVAARFVERYPQFPTRFYIIGDGEWRASLEELAESLGIRSLVEFEGWQRELHEVYARLDIVMLTSNNEGTPVSLIEAMASGRPVISSDVGGVRDILGSAVGPQKDEKHLFEQTERGILVKAGDREGFVEALAFCIASRQKRHSVVASARDFVKAHYASGRLIRDIENIYQNLLSRDPA